MADAAAARTCSQLSTTSRSRRPASASATVSISAASPCGVMPSAVAMAAGDRGRVADRGQLDHPHALGELAGQLGADLERQPGLADPSDAAQRDQPVRPHELGDLGDQILAADEGAQLLREVAREAVHAPEHGELRPESVGDDLVHRHPPTQAAEPMLTQRPQRHPVPQQHLGRVGDDHLAAVRERHQPCGAVHVGAEVVPVAFDRLAGVQTHPDPEGDGGVGEQLSAIRSRRSPRRRPSRTRRRSRHRRWRTRSRRGVRSCRARWRRGPAAHRPCPSGLLPTDASSPRCR